MESVFNNGLIIQFGYITTTQGNETVLFPISPLTWAEVIPHNNFLSYAANLCTYNDLSNITGCTTEITLSGFTFRCCTPAYWIAICI